MRRFLIDASSVTESKITIQNKREINHIRNVLRLKPEAEVLLSDGTGKEYYSKLTGYDEGSAVAYFDVLYVRDTDTEPETNVTLFQCIPKGNKMEQIIQKSVELGVHAVVPVMSERSIVRTSDMDSKLSRWRRIAEEACKQSGRSIVPEVLACTDISHIAGVLSKDTFIILPYEQEKNVSIKNVLRSCDSRDIALIIGPEGGFTENEVVKLRDAGAHICSLGRTILRTETAGPASIAMIMYELELII